MEKITISSNESVELLSNGKNLATLTGLIDTGARTTSLDESFVKENLPEAKEALEAFNAVISEVENLEEYITNNSSMGFADILEKLHDHPIIKDVQKVRSSHGLSLRPYIELDFIIRGKSVTALCNVYDRSQMTYPLLIGRNVLKNNFIVDVAI